jgi:hypothetical protein
MKGLEETQKRGGNKEEGKEGTGERRKEEERGKK